MIDVNHTEECRLAREKERTERAAYEKRWPGYCRRCDAEGGSSGRSTYDYCPDCVGQGICPRCGSDDTNFLEEDEGFENPVCNSCGWKEGDPGCPVVENDCGCLYP